MRLQLSDIFRTQNQTQGDPTLNGNAAGQTPTSTGNPTIDSIFGGVNTLLPAVGTLIGKTKGNDVKIVQAQAQSEKAKSNVVKYVFIGLGLVVVGTVVFFVLRRRRL